MTTDQSNSTQPNQQDEPEHGGALFKPSKGKKVVKRYRSQIREAMNRNVVVTLALEQGFNAYLPVYDGGVDFILHKEGGRNDRPETRKVQLKGRPMIAKHYRGKDIWMAFPIGTDWYLVPHDELLAFADKHTKALTSRSWRREDGAYSWPKPSKAMTAFVKEYRFAPIERVAAEAAADAEA